MSIFERFVRWLDFKVFRHKWVWFCNWVWDLELESDPKYAEELELFFKEIEEKKS